MADRTIRIYGRDITSEHLSRALEEAIEAPDRHARMRQLITRSIRFADEDWDAQHSEAPVKAKLKDAA